MTHRRPLVVVACSLLLTTAAFAIQDRRPTPLAIDKTYVTEMPIGKLRIVYALLPQTGEATLQVECNLFRVPVLAEALAGLPNPDWDAMTVSTFRGMRLDGQEPPMPAYANVRVPLLGPTDAGGRETRVAHFTCRADGSITRRLDRLVDGQWRTRAWPLDSTLSAEAVLADLAPATTRPATP